MDIEEDFERNSSFKIKEPKDTIKFLLERFKDFGLNIRYDTHENGNKLFWTVVILKDINLTFIGKGLSKDESIASGLAEVAERLSGLALAPGISDISLLNRFIVGDETHIRDFSYLNNYFRSFKGDTNSIGINEITTMKTFSKIKGLTDVWCTSFDMIKKELVFVPYAIENMFASSNGLAAGNTLNEAIIQGTNEIFERFATITVLRNTDKKLYKTIDTKSINNNKIRHIIEYFESNGIEIFIKDFTLGNTLPCFGLLTVDNKGNRKLSVASSFNSHEAILRCFTEILQGIYSIKNTNIYSESINTKDNSEMMFLKNKTTNTDLKFLEKGELVSLDDFDYITNIKEEFKKIFNIIKINDLRLLVVNHTHPIIKFPVVKVIIPGLSSLWRFFGDCEFARIENKFVNHSRSEEFYKKLRMTR